MHTIVFDLEFNQDPSDERFPKTLFEIIQIGAIKLDVDFNTLATFNRLIKPTLYRKITPLVTDLTGITMEQLQSEEDFPQVYQDFNAFIGGSDGILCSWGLSDIKALFRNVDYFDLDKEPLPRLFINLQPLVSKHLGLSSKKMLRLEYAVEALNIAKQYDFHHALHDAYYTAELLKKVYTPAIQPKTYDPTQKLQRPRAPRVVVDYEQLLQQIEKMYARKITLEEQGMIKLAYKMGRTQQFTKEVQPAPKPAPKNHS